MISPFILYTFRGCSQGRFFSLKNPMHFNGANLRLSSTTRNLTRFCATEVAWNFCGVNYGADFPLEWKGCGFWHRIFVKIQHVNILIVATECFVNKLSVCDRSAWAPLQLFTSASAIGTKLLVSFFGGGWFKSSPVFRLQTCFLFRQVKIWAYSTRFTHFRSQFDPYS